MKPFIQRAAIDEQPPAGPAQPVQITDAEFARVQQLAMRLAGISIAASKKALIVGRWSRRLAHHGLANFAAYLDLLSSDGSAPELQTALDLLTTNETSFFREPKHFEFLQKEVLPKAPRGSRLRAWSAACSSGEEPFSVAMLLAAVRGDAPWDVLGTDISSRVLAAARTALYDLARAESIPPEYLKRFCLRGTGPHEGRFLIDRAVRDRVQFARANLNEPLPDFGQFDVILLRNVLIYFDTETKARVIRHLVPALRPGGYFIIGHCDALAGVDHTLSMCSASVYRKA